MATIMRGLVSSCMTYDVVHNWNHGSQLWIHVYPHMSHTIHYIDIYSVAMIEHDCCVMSIVYIHTTYQYVHVSMEIHIWYMAM